ncbi:MAG TPA: hypothetical protein PLR99_00650 [Polyangiaceae bacterium]|jgi:hypothetical protein|nr:hypothetical protein [Polyangiaceae bacterium]
MRFRTTPLFAIAVTSALMGLASLHCGAGAFGPTSADAGGPLSADTGANDLSADAGADIERGTPTALEAGTADVAPPPLSPNVIESNLLVLANASSLPAFRLCPASASGPTLSNSPRRPMPEVLMPGSSLEGVPERGAVAVLPDARFLPGANSVVVLWIDEVTKNHPGLATGSCSALACVGGPGCLDDGTGADRHVTVVKVTDWAFDKKGVVVLEGASKASATFTTRTTAQSFNAKAGTLDVQLFDEVKSGARVSFQAPDGGSTSITSRATLEYDGFGGAFVAGTHRETLLEVHANSAPRRPIVDYYATPGLFALFLLGTPGDLRFVAVPTHQ